MQITRDKFEKMAGTAMVYIGQKLPDCAHRILNINQFSLADELEKAIKPEKIDLPEVDPNTPRNGPATGGRV